MDYEQLARRLAGRRYPRRRDHAVLVPVSEEQEGLSLLFEVRAATLRTQPGEVCFPGGSLEEGEEPLAAALRETEEELGLGREWLSPGPALEPNYHRMGEVTWPFLCRLAPGWREALRPNEAEVAQVFCVPLDFFRQTPPELYRCQLVTVPPEDFPNDKIGFPGGYHWAHGETVVPLWMWEGKAIWGLTARMVRSLVDGL